MSSYRKRKKDLRKKSTVPKVQSSRINRLEVLLLLHCCGITLMTLLHSVCPANKSGRLTVEDNSGLGVSNAMIGLTWHVQMQRMTITIVIFLPKIKMFSFKLPYNQTNCLVYFKFLKKLFCRIKFFYRNTYFLCDISNI